MFTAEEGEVFGPYEEDSFFKVAKINDVKMLPDSVKARHILIQPINNDFAGAKVKADSLANLLRKGADFDKMAREISADKNSAVNGGDLGWFGPRQMVQPFSDTCFFAKKNKIKVVLTQFGAHVVQVTEQAKRKEKFRLLLWQEKYRQVRILLIKFIPKPLNSLRMLRLQKTSLLAQKKKE